MAPVKPIVVIGTFDSKGAEHLFLKQAIERRGIRAVTINVGTKSEPSFTPDVDLRPRTKGLSRDQAIEAALEMGRQFVAKLQAKGWLGGIISAGGGTGTHLGTGIMRALPLGVPKVMVSTVASRDQSEVVGVKDITMIHSVVDLLGVNSISGMILDQAAAAVCAMAQSDFEPPADKKRVALTMFGFITEGAERVKAELEARGYEVIAFHANGTGGPAMENLAAEGRFDGILDLAPHEFADTMFDGYCRMIAKGRLEPVPGHKVPRLVVPGGLDCAVLEFTRETVPEQYRDRKIFYYDFRSAIRLDIEESKTLAADLAKKLNRASSAKVLVPTRGWSEADREGGPLYDPEINQAFVTHLKSKLGIFTEVSEVDAHINDAQFAQAAAELMDRMISG